MRRATPGFSLIEVVLALGVVGFALLAIIGMLPIGLQSGRASVQETRANFLAQEIFATLRSQPFTAADLSQLTGTQVAPINLANENTQVGGTPTQLHANLQGNFTGAADYFTIDLKFRNAPDGLVAGTANEVHLQITFRDKGAQPLNYATIIAAQ